MNSIPDRCYSIEDFNLFSSYPSEFNLTVKQQKSIIRRQMLGHGEAYFSVSAVGFLPFVMLFVAYTGADDLWQVSNSVSWNEFLPLAIVIGLVFGYNFGMFAELNANKHDFANKKSVYEDAMAFADAYPEVHVFNNAYNDLLNEHSRDSEDFRVKSRSLKDKYSEFIDGILSDEFREAEAVQAEYVEELNGKLTHAGNEPLVLASLSVSHIRENVQDRTMRKSNDIQDILRLSVSEVGNECDSNNDRGRR